MIFFAVLAALAVLGTACSGSDPLDSADSSTSTSSNETTDPETVTTATTAATTTTTEAPPTSSDCQTLVGPGPWPVSIEPEISPAVFCGKIAPHHRIAFSNNTEEVVEFSLGDTPVSIEPGNQLVTEPVGTFLQPGLTEIETVNYGVSSPWLISGDEDPMASSKMLLAGLGPITIGMGVGDATTELGGDGLAPVNQACATSYIAGDPHSPLFTVRDDAIAVIQVFTPGQETRSGIGIGSAEADIVAAYGANIVSQPSADGNPDKKLLVFVPSDAGDQIYRLVFVVEKGIVTSLRSGLTEFVISNPNCS